MIGDPKKKTRRVDIEVIEGTAFKFSNVTTIAELMAELSENAESGEQVLSLMEDWLQRPDGAVELVEALAASEVPIIVRTLAFLLARAASSRALGVPLGGLVLQAIERLRVDDDSVYMNLLSAMQLSSMHDDLVVADQPLPSSAMEFLINCASRSEAVQSTLAPTVGALHAHGVLARAPRERVEHLRSLLRQLEAPAGSLLAMELADLEPFLA